VRVRDKVLGEGRCSGRAKMKRAAIAATTASEIAVETGWRTVSTRKGSAVRCACASPGRGIG